jgi:hypothetical protein
MLNLRLEADAISRISDMIAPMCDGDEELLHDMMTGETAIDHLVRRLHEQVARDGEQLVGIGERQRDLADRKARISKRQDAMKAGIGMLLRAARLTKLELPEVTYSVREGKPALRVVDPEAVPEELQRIKREPDKTAINETFADESSLPNWLVREPARDVVTARVK